MMKRNHGDHYYIQFSKYPLLLVSLLHVENFNLIFWLKKIESDLPCNNSAI